MPTRETDIAGTALIESAARTTRPAGEYVECELSVVIPAFEEAGRLPPHLDAIRQNFVANRTNYEVIVVDDGGHDGTTDLVEESQREWPELRLIRHSRNLGKGAALRTGIAAARGQAILLTDADGATPIGEEAKLRAILADQADIVVGSRLLADFSTQRNRLPVRNVLGRGFATCARRILGLPVSDPQCGFKLLQSPVARELFPICDEVGYLFDAQLLRHAVRRGFRIVDVPISWQEIPGSKVHRFRDGWRMLWGLVRLRYRTRRTASTSRRVHGFSDLSCRNSQGTRPSGSA